MSFYNVTVDVKPPYENINGGLYIETTTILEEPLILRELEERMEIGL